MSDKSSTFAPEIGKGRIDYSAPETYRATLGSDPGGIRRSKTHTASAREKREEPCRFRASLFSFYILVMKFACMYFYHMLFECLQHFVNWVLTSANKT